MKKGLCLSMMLLAAGATFVFAACKAYGEHNFELKEVIQEATCLSEGSAKYVCSDCGYVETRAIEALGHDWGEWEGTPATCWDQGVEFRICKNDPTHRETRATEELGHDWSDWTVEIPATCLEQGKEVRICKNDSTHRETRATEPLGHTDASQNWVMLGESTCIVSGAESLLCDRCFEPLDTRRAAVLAHEYLNGVCVNCGRRDWSVAQIDDPDLYNSEYGFRMLAEEDKGAAMQALYLLIDENARAYHNGTSDSKILGAYDYAALGLTMDEMVAVWKTYLDDHPLYYWLDRTMNYADVAEVLIDASYANHEVRHSLNQMIYEKANAWREDTDENAYLAALSYHDKIIYEVDYLESGRIYPEGTSWAHNIVGVFEGKGAVCEGYSRSFQLLLNMTGIENVFVTGKSENAAHAWNLVKLDDEKWYWFDLTFDDTPNWMWGVQYNYFAVTDEQNINWSDDYGYYNTAVYFAAKHTPDSGTGVEFLVRLPEAAKTPYEGVGELRLRQTFTVGESTYAVAGYHAVQLIECNATGDVYIPETVEFEGVTYDVISVGAMDEEGFFKDSRMEEVYMKPIETLYLPASIRFLWTNAVHNFYNGGFTAFDVAAENQMFESVDGVLFTKGLYTLIAYPVKSPRTEYKIPDGVILIAHIAFGDRAKNLRSFTIGKDTNSPSGNFNWGMGWLRNATEGSHSFSVGQWGDAIEDMLALETLSVDPENQNYIVENNLLLSKDKTILYAALYSVVELVIPATVEEIETYACWNRYKLERIIFEGNNIRYISSSAFANNYLFREIIFHGTQEEWDAVDKEGLSNIFNDYTVTCTQK